MLTDLPVNLILLAISAYLLCSANLLTWLGIPYTIEGGSLVFKIHPGTYFLLAVALTYCVHGIARRQIRMPAASSAPAWIYSLGILCCCAYAAVMTGKGNIVVFLDTFLPAGVLAIVVSQRNLQARQRLRNLLQVLIVFNSITAIFEMATKENIVPIFMLGTAFEAQGEEFRPTAFYDHPLTGGTLTMMGLALLPETAFLRRAYAAVLALALLAFGGRVAVACALLSTALYQAIRLSQATLARQQRCYRRVATLLLLSLFVVSTAIVLFSTGLSSRLSAHLYWDASAQVRLSQWSIFSLLRPEQLILGTNRDELISTLEILRLNDGLQVLENFWLLTFVSLGLLGFSLFLPAYLCLLTGIWRSAGLRGKLLLLAFIVTVSTSNSLGRKSCLLVMLVAVSSCVKEPCEKSLSRYVQPALARA